MNRRADEPTGDDPHAPRPLADGLDRVVAGLGEDQRRARGGARGAAAAGGSAAAPADGARPGGASRGASALFARWGELVGPDIAAHTRPLRLQEGRLVVSTADPAWASQLRWLESELVRRIAEAGGPQLEGLIVRVRRP